MKINDSLKNLMKVSQEMICILSLKGDFLHVNKSFCDHTGYSSEELFCNSIYDYIHPDDREKYFHFFKNLINGLSTYIEIEYRLIHKKGNIICLSWSFTAIEENNVFALARNDTKLKEENILLQKQLSENFAYSNAFARFMPQMLWTANSDGKVDFYNQCSLEYTGMTQENANGRTWFSLLHPDDREKTIHEWSHSVLTGKLYVTEFRLKRHSCKSYRWLQSKAYPLKDEKGKIKKWFGSCTDIDELKQLQKEVKGEKIFLNNIYNNFSIYIFVVDKKGVIDYSMGFIPPILKLKPEKLYGKNALSIFNEYPAVQNSIKKALIGVENSEQILIDGYNYEICYKPLQNELNEICGMVGVIQSRSFNEIHYNSNNTQLVDIINNELRAPLHTIISFAEILEEKIKDEEAKKYLKFIISSGDLMKNFLMNIYNLDHSLNVDKSQKDLFC